MADVRTIEVADISEVRCVGHDGGRIIEVVADLKSGEQLILLRAVLSSAVIADAALVVKYAREASQLALRMIGVEDRAVRDASFSGPFPMTPPKGPAN